MKAETALEITESALAETEEKSQQLQHQLIASEMKLKLKEEELLEAKKEIDRSRASSVELAKQKDKLEVCVCVKACVHVCIGLQVLVNGSQLLTLGTPH